LSGVETERESEEPLLIGDRREDGRRNAGSTGRRRLPNPFCWL